ncbi:MAG: type II toxin-antitoxin system RelE/ParE family toxin [Treponema sp.]|jgi:addiction module RelE/StbE family toxin|nr:type II toxin-antitoxin system RelE/ParE family toxin [Treponema sp.]
MAKEIKKYGANITANTKKDLREIVPCISQNNPQNALKILERIEAKIKTLDHFPNRGGYVPELLKKNIKEYRQITESPWRIIYRVDKNIATILLVIDSRRNIQDILTQRLIK